VTRDGCGYVFWKSLGLAQSRGLFPSKWVKGVGDMDQGSSNEWEALRTQCAELKSGRSTLRRWFDEPASELR
jgi:hypothetical protein